MPTCGARPEPQWLPVHGSSGLWRYWATTFPTTFAGQGCFGWSTGRPLTSTFLADSNQLFLGLKEWLAGHGFTGPLFVMGRSLGSASAIEVAVNHSDAVTGLIIESGFARTLPLARVLGVDLEALGEIGLQRLGNGEDRRRGIRRRNKNGRRNRRKIGHRETPE